MELPLSDDTLLHACADVTVGALMIARTWLLNARATRAGAARKGADRDATDRASSLMRAIR